MPISTREKKFRTQIVLIVDELDAQELVRESDEPQNVHGIARVKNRKPMTNINP